MTYYISLYVGAKRLVFHLSPRDGHVIIVSRCLILTAVNLIVLIRMAYITERLVKLCKIYCDIWHLLTWRVCTGGRAVVRYVKTKFSRMDSLPNFVTMVLRRARARAPLTMLISAFCIIDFITVELEVLEKRRGVLSRIIHNINTYPCTRVKVCTSLRWLNTFLAVSEYMSFAKSWQEKGCSSQAETWQGEIYWWKILIDR